MVIEGHPARTVDSHFFEEPFHFSVIHASDSSFIVKLLLLTDVAEELKPVLVETVFIFVTRNISHKNID